MIVQCDSCKRYFDNEFRLTYCPHDTFAANDGKNNFAHHPESYLSSEAPKSTRDRPHLLHWWALTLALLLAAPASAQDAKVIELKSTDAFTAQKVYDALRKAEKDRDEFEAYVKKTYLVVDKDDPEASTTIAEGPSSRPVRCPGAMNILDMETVLDMEKCKQAEANWKYRFYRAGWENGFLFSRDFRFLVPRIITPVTGCVNCVPWVIR